MNTLKMTGFSLDFTKREIIMAGQRGRGRGKGEGGNKGKGCASVESGGKC